MPKAVISNDILYGIFDYYLPKLALLPGRVFSLQPGYQYFLGGYPGNRQRDLA
jgi:hypothetical protein